jgi:hypothetical protein
MGSGDPLLLELVAQFLFAFCFRSGGEEAVRADRGPRGPVSTMIGPLVAGPREGWETAGLLVEGGGAVTLPVSGPGNFADGTRGHTETVGERFERDRAALLPLPATPYEACEKISARVSSLSLVRYRGNDYSVPTEYGHRQVWVKGYVHEVVIACAGEVIARHQRSYEREAVVFDPLHYLALLEQKTRALDQAAPLAGWQLPECFAQLRRLLEARLSKHGSREYVQVLRLLETFDLAELSLALEDALRLGTIGFDAVRHLLLCRIERRPPRLDMENYPHLPLAQVRTTQAADYMTLLAEVCA